MLNWGFRLWVSAPVKHLETAEDKAGTENGMMNELNYVIIEITVHVSLLYEF